jgi:hypothetical protein
MANTPIADAGVRATGSCLCGAVRFEVVGTLRDVVECHCAMCRKTHGHIGAYTATPKDGLRIVEARGLKWYRSSAQARRGFCGGGTCSEPLTKDYMAIAPGPRRSDRLEDGRTGHVLAPATTTRSTRRFASGGIEGTLSQSRGQLAVAAIAE